METELERLVVRLIGDGSSYQNMIRQAEISTARLSDSVQYHSQRIAGIGLSLKGYASSVAGLVAAGAAVAGVGLGIGAVGTAVTKAASMEQTKVAFEALIGDAERSQKVLADLYKFAADTPFEFPEVSAAAKRMLAFGATAEDIVPTMKKLGDVASALEIPLGQLTYVFGTLKSQQIAHTVDINQFAERGIPIWQELEKITGKNNVELRKMVEAGQVGFPIIDQAFENMTKSGGRFANMMEKQSQTLKGLFSTLRDDVGMALTGLGDKLVDVFGLKQMLKDLDAAAKESARWVDFLADRFIEGGKAVRDFFGTTGVQAFYDAANATREWAEDNRKLVLGLSLTAAAVGLVVVAYHVLKTALLTTLAVSALLHLDQVASVALWVVYKGVLLAASAAQAVYAGTTWVVNAALAVANVAALAMTGSITLATTATWLWNAALAVLSAETMIPLLVAAAALAVTVGVMVTAGAALYGTFVGIYQAGSSVLDLFLKMPTGSGPLKAVGDTFVGWYDTLVRISEVASMDLPAAWTLVQEAAKVAVLQIRDLWPPLWTFLQEGFTVVWRLASFNFVTEFKRGFAVVLADVAKYADVFGLNRRKIERDIEAMNEKVKEGQTKAAEIAGEMLGEAVERFNQSFVSSPETLSAMKNLSRMIDEAWQDAFWTDFWAKFDTAAAQGGKKVEEMPAVAMKITPRFDAAAWNSAEAASRIAEFRDRLGLNPAAHASVVTPQATPFGGGPVGPGLDWQRTVFYDIRDELKKLNAKKETDAKEFADALQASESTDDSTDWF